METKDRLKEIATKQKLTTADKKFVQDVCGELGITIANTGCKQCYTDAAIEAWKAIASEEVKTANVHYRLKEGTRLLHNHELVCEATATDEKIEKWLSTGLPACYVVTI